MRKILLLLLLSPIFCISQTIMSWNIQNLGETKFKRDTIIPTIANVIKKSKADIIAIQEVSTNKYGDSCIIQLARLLNYNYIISKPTTGSGSERYAYLYNKSIVMNYNHLDNTLQDVIDREPYIASFTYNKKNIILRQIHLVPTEKNPQNEIEKLYKYNDGIICGDFNLTDEHLIYIPLLTKFISPLMSQKTSLKRNGDYNNSYDHFLVAKNISYKSSRVYLYDYKYNRNKLSDHLPIILVL